MRALVVIGTRPEAIKMLPLVKEMKKQKEFETLVCFSGQHETLANNVFELFDITPDYRFLGLQKNISLNEMTTSFLNYFDTLFKEITPDIILVHGDTTTAFCASLAGFYQGIKIAHIEAGLRTFNHLSPFPEEFNRAAIDTLSTLHFAPTNESAKNLIREGRRSVFTTGNTCIDAFKYTLCENYFSPILKEAQNKKIILITTHRRENLGDKMSSSLSGIKDALQDRNDVFAIIPTHPNPLVKNAVESIFHSIKNIKICPPLPLYDFHNILARSHLIISDSGGIQEEAAYLGIPLFLLRDTTERIECINKNAKMIGTEKERVFNEITQALNNPHILKNMQQKSLTFGDGNASKKIVKNLLSLLKKDDIIK
ncbi:MAG: UDP-N-acetylglucosamine 2-epimerase (non-hydrolyzing) [Clostridia bacterium]|nr:UDP-N-acetylglucosamine 2-epimerase (non-hydrolyzing) [Clostridia bacterium]